MVLMVDDCYRMAHSLDRLAHSHESRHMADAHPERVHWMVAHNRRLRIDRTHMIEAGDSTTLRDQ